MALPARGRASYAPATAAANPRDTQDLHTTAVLLQPAEMLDAWRPDSGRLLVPSATAPRLGQRVALRIQLTDNPIAATVLGKTASVQRHGAWIRIEVAPDPDSLAAIRLLLAAARGAPIQFLERQLRWLVRLPVMVGTGDGTVYMHTFSVAESGCGLTWSGAPPQVGQRVRLRFALNRGVEVEGLVRWVSDRGSAAGVELDGRRGRAAGWGGVLADVVASGAPLA